MLETKRKIPTVATASLVLGGTAGVSCGDDGGNASLAKRACNAFEKCDPEYFTEYYDSKAQCRRELRYYIDYYEDYLTEEYGRACANALLRYYDCFVSVYSRTCDEYTTEERCYDAYLDYYDACGL